jgi:hypothetical protein
MKFKEGVNPFGIRPEMVIALQVIDGVYAIFKKELWVTSLNDSKHSLTSLHYAGCAADLRTRYFDSPATVEKVAELIRVSLGNNPDFDVIVEVDHIHIEYQPKRRG